VITALLVWALQQQPDAPVVIDITPPPKGDPTGLSDVLIGALGLSGMLILCAVILAAIFAGILFFWRSRVGLDVNPEETRDHHIV
jgi:hypothetical protein